MLDRNRLKFEVYISCFGKMIVRPEGYALSRVQVVNHNDVKAFIGRYERTDGVCNHVGGEHVSIIIDTNGRLLGYTRMDTNLSENELPSEKDALCVANNFVEKYAPDLVGKLENLWIKPHPEEIYVEDGSCKTITGMKVKFYNADNDLYSWVIVSSEQKIISFERDIEWVVMPGFRKTQKWLHDNWLIEQSERQRQNML